MIAVLIVFLAANKKKESEEKNKKNETATRQKQVSVTVSNAIARKIGKKKNNTRTGHLQDRDLRETTVKTAHNGSTC